MTSGPSHYAEAERLAGPHPAYPGINKSETRPPTPAETALAQVHATLALTAATLATSNRRVTDADDWAGVLAG